MFNLTYQRLLHDPWHQERWGLPPNRRAIPKPVVFIPGRAKGDANTLLQEAFVLLRRDAVEVIAIPGTDGSRKGADPNGKLIPTGYAGATIWQQLLMEMGAAYEQVLLTRGKGYHTRTEVDFFLQLAKDKGWLEGYILAHPHQTLRIMLSVLQSRKGFNWPIVLRPLTPTKTNWDAEVHGSQGEKKMPRARHISEELGRVPQYHASGDLASFDELGCYYRDELGVTWPLWKELQKE